MYDACKKAKFPVSGGMFNGVLFHCVGNAAGDVVVRERCWRNGCKQNGKGVNDVVIRSWDGDSSRRDEKGGS